jgi:hypothetical protein
VVNTSASGGYLAPEAVPAPLEGEALLRFIQQFVVGITGLPGDMVRPRWQPEPPNIPSAGEAWAAIGVSARPSDTYPYVGEIDTPEGGVAELQRHEDLNILSSFYGLGSGSLADEFCARLRDGLSISQNLEPLFHAGMGFISCGVPVAVPSLLKERWLYRVDLPFGIRRAIVRRYPVRTILSAEGEVQDNPEGTRVITQKFAVNP